MNRARFLGLSLSSLAASTPFTFGQESAPCRCCALTRFYAPYIKDLPAPPFREGIGNSQMKISTKSKVAQKWFNQGLNLLHAFWEFEAYRAFLQAAEADPDCAMAYWGIGMSLPGKDPEAKEERNAALEKALELSANNPAPEKHYIQALEQLVALGPKKAAEVFRTYLKESPNDPEATAFLSFWLRDGNTPDGAPKKGTQEGLKLLDDALKKHPKHVGLHHYRIHLLETGPNFLGALDSALLLPEAAPNAPHLVHMPGHIFYLQGNYPAAVEIFKLSRRVEEAYLNGEKIPAIDSPNYLHNLHFLSFAAVECGKIDLALEAATSFASITIPPERLAAIGAGQTNYLARQMVPLVHARLGEFEEAAKLIRFDDLPPESPPRILFEGFQTYFNLRARFAKEELPRIELLKAKLNFDQIINRFKKARPIKLTVTNRMPYQTSLVILDLLAMELAAFFEAPTASDDSLTLKMEISSEKQHRLAYIEPPFLPWCLEERFGDLWITRGNKKEAAKWYQLALKRRPTSGHILLRLARATGLKKDYQDFLMAWEEADGNRPELAEARGAIK